jgi:carboxylesterase
MSVVFSLDRTPSKSYASRKSQDKNGLYLKGDNGSSVILIHGLTGTPNEMKFLANFLNRKGYSVICPRLANHGETISVLKNTKWQDFYESVREVVIGRGLANNTGPVFAAGLSMGALLALLLANEFKDRIHGVSCIAPTLFYDGWNAPRSKYLLPLAHYTFLKYFFYFKEEPPYGIKNETIQERLHRYYNAARLEDMEGVAQYGYPYFPVSLLCQLRLLVKYISKRLTIMSFPLQLIQAKDDDVASVKNSKFIYDRIGSEIKEMILLYDSYHVITADHERDIVAEKIENFFNRIITNSAET